MKKFLLFLVTALVAVGLTSSSALAAVNVKSAPTATFSGATVTLTNGNFSGLGSTPAVGNLTATGVANYHCSNPQGNPSPGQNPVPANPGSSGLIDLGNADHNGRGTINGASASVTAPSTPTPQQVGCGGAGNTKWTVVLDSLLATAANLTVTQPQGGPVVFCRNYTLGGPATGTPC